MKPKPMTIVATIIAAALPSWAATAHDGRHYYESAIGHTAEADQVTRTIEIRMTDSKDRTVIFEPSSIDVKRGTSVRLVISNDGVVPHEFVMAAPSEIDEHRSEMDGITDMEHIASYALRLDPGETDEIEWTFASDGIFAFACLIPEHGSSGMVGVVTVE